MCNRDGSELVPLTSLGASVTGSPSWSPDGSQIAFDSNVDGEFAVYRIAADGGSPVRVTEGIAMDFAPEWSADGMWIFFTSDRSGRFEIWKIKAGGGEAVPVTRNGAWRPKVGPNGRWIYYNRDGIPSDQSTTLWRISADGSEESCVLKSVYRGLWAVGREEVYYAPPPELEAPVCIYRLLLPDRTREKATCIDQPLYGRIELAPDEQSLLYTQIDAIGSDIMLVENFR